MNMINRTRTTGLVLALLSGAPVSAVAQYDQENRPATRVQARDASAQARPEFHKSGALIGKDVINDNDETIASVSDFIFDRGSGQIRYAVLTSGAVLGLGGKAVVAPYAQLGWEPVEAKFTLSMTEEQIGRAAEFDPEKWPSLDQRTWSDTVDGLWGDPDADSRRRAHDKAADEHARMLRDQRSEQIQGAVVGVDRKRTELFDDETVCVTVRSDSGETRELVLGPAWYVMGAEAAPMRGDQIRAEYATIRPGADEVRIARSATIDGEELRLRDDRWNGRWDLPGEARSGGEESRSRRLMLVSDLVGANAFTSTRDEAGEIQNVVIERASGRIALLGFDPNENFLGLGDQIKAVPWSVASIASADTVRIDATDAQISGAPDFPDDVSTLESGDGLNAVYGAFGVEPQRFEKAHAQKPTDADAGDRDAKFFREFVDGEPVSLSGELKGMETRSIDRRTGPVTVMTIATSEGDRRVIVGPQWFVDRQSMNLHKGDRVSVKARQASVDGQTHLVAWSLRTSQREYSLWKGDRPAWNGG